MKLLAGVRILVTDDEPFLRDVLRFILEREGATVSEAEHAEAALEKLRVEQFQILITDNRMPGLSGIEMIKEIKAHFTTPPLIFLCTAYADISLESVRQLGAEGLFHKPFERSAIIDELTSVTQGGKLPSPATQRL